MMDVLPVVYLARDGFSAKMGRKKKWYLPMIRAHCIADVGVLWVFRNTEGGTAVQNASRLLVESSCRQSSHVHPTG